MRLLIALCLVATITMSARAAEPSYEYGAIAQRYKGEGLTPDQVKQAQMQGECLVGLKELNFKKRNSFDAVAEWTNYRTVSLLDHYSPCEVLVIMEVAQKKLRESDSR